MENQKIIQRDIENNGCLDMPFTFSLDTGVQINTFQLSQGPNKIEFYDGKAIEAVLFYLRQDPHSNIAILNFANGITPGEGYLEGALVQEADLCRQSPYLYASLNVAKKGGLYDPWSRGLQQGQDEKVNWDSQILYTPNALFIRDGLNLLTHSSKVSVISAVAPFSKNIKDSNQITPLLPKFKKVITYIYSAPILAQTQSDDFRSPSTVGRTLKDVNPPPIDILILGAWGCGAFAPTDLNVQDVYRQKVAQCFVEVLKTIGGHYKLICFAIPGGDNYRIFENEFKKNNLIGGKNYYYKYQKYKHKYNALKKLSNGMNPR